LLLSDYFQATLLASTTGSPDFSRFSSTVAMNNAGDIAYLSTKSSQNIQQVLLRTADGQAHNATPLLPDGSRLQFDSFALSDHDVLTAKSGDQVWQWSGLAPAGAKTLYAGDTAGPAASVIRWTAVPNGGTTERFVITYQDPDGVDYSSVTAARITLTHSQSSPISAQLERAVSSADRRAVSAYYSVGLPAGNTGGWSVQIPARSIADLSVSLDPAEIQAHARNWTASQSLGMSGEPVTAGDLVINASSILVSGANDFDSLGIGQQLQRVFKLHNDSTQDIDLTKSSLQITGSKDFSATTDLKGMLSAGGDLDVTVTYRPKAAGRVFSSISVAGFYFQVAGTGVPATVKVNPITYQGLRGLAFASLAASSQGRAAFFADVNNSDPARASRSAIETPAFNQVGSLHAAAVNLTEQTISLDASGKVLVTPGGWPGAAANAQLSPILLFPSDLSTTVTLANQSRFDDLGVGMISDDGRAVVFVGNLKSSVAASEKSAFGAAGRGLFICFSPSGGSPSSYSKAAKLIGSSDDYGYDPGESWFDLPKDSSSIGGDNQVTPNETSGGIGFGPHVNTLGVHMSLSSKLGQSPSTLQVYLTDGPLFNVIVHMLWDPSSGLATPKFVTADPQDVSVDAGQMGTPVQGISIPSFFPDDYTTGVMNNAGTIVELGQLSNRSITDHTTDMVMLNILRRPLLFIPGIAGSFPAGVLNNPAGSTFDAWLMRLGGSKSSGGVTPDTLAMDPLTGAYDNLTQTLLASGYVLNKDLFLVPYDWRLPLINLNQSMSASDVASDTYAYGINYLGYWLRKAQEMWISTYHVPLDMVDIVAHSMGGLLARAYIQGTAAGRQYDSDPSHILPAVNHLTMIATPNRGASKVFNILHDNWIFDPTYQLILSAITNLAYQNVLNGTPLIGPDNSALLTKAQLESNPALSAVTFIQTYLAGALALLPSYNFRMIGSQQVEKPPGNNSDYSKPDPFPVLNKLLFQLNGGDYLNDDTKGPPGGTALDDLFGSASVTMLYSDQLSTGTFDQVENGPSNDVAAQIFNMASDFSRGGHTGETWYKDIATTSAKQPWGALGQEGGGDGTVPTTSAIGLFVGRAIFEARSGFHESNAAVYDIAPGPGSSGDGAYDHVGLVSNRAAQQRVLLSLGMPALKSAAHTGGKGPILDVLDAPNLGRKVLVVTHKRVVPRAILSGIVQPIALSIGDAGNKIIYFIIGPPSGSASPAAAAPAAKLDVTLTGSGSSYFAHINLFDSNGSAVGATSNGSLAANAVMTLHILPVPADAGTINGVLFSDQNDDGTRQATEPVLAGYRVFIDTNSDGVFQSSELSSVSDASGKFSFKGLTAGTYLIGLAPVTGWRPTGPNNGFIPVTINSNQTVSTTLGATQKGRIAGTVFADSNSNGRHDSGEGGVVNIPLFLDLNHNGRLDSGEPFTLTDASGNYLFKNLAAGTYHVTVIPPTGQKINLLGGVSKDVTVVADFTSNGPAYPLIAASGGGVAAPTGVMINGAGLGVLIITWNPVAAATNYIVERSTDNKTFTRMTVTSIQYYIDQTVTFGTRYYYRVYAANGIATSSASTTVSAVA
jgi:hypothetical protein